jgi:hypothetical protein
MRTKLMFLMKAYAKPSKHTKLSKLVFVALPHFVLLLTYKSKVNSLNAIS